MGIFGRLLGGDPRRDLERAESLLGRGEAARALELAARAGRSPSPMDRERAGRLAASAREALAAEALERAARAEASEYFEDAAEWVTTALEHVADEARRAELEARAASLRARARETAAEDAFDPEGFGAGELPQAAELDPEDHFLALLGMLEDAAADRYEAQPAAFRRAFVDLNEGRAEPALAVLEELAARPPGDPVALLERGRARLLTGDPGGARADFEAVWATWGDGPLDRANAISVPGLWAEALLAAGEPGPVLERLEDLAEPAAGRPALSLLYAQALVMIGRLEEARRFLLAAAGRFPSDQEFPYLLAGVLGRLGEGERAIDCLEGAIAPSCATGSCRRPPKHVPSLRALAGLYLDRGEELGRVEDLLTHLAQAQGGRLAAPDQLLLAKYHDLTGNPVAAERARAAAGTG